jgi:LacI family transcriptional regulator
MKKDSRPCNGHVSQADVARACGVSRSTVSAVLLGEKSTGVVSVATRRIVMDAVLRMGYRGHSAAQALRSGRTQAVALAIPYPEIIQGVIPGQILQGIIERTQQIGYAVHICTYSEEGDMLGSLLQAVQESRVDGVFFYADQRLAKDPREAMLSEWGMPFVALHKHSTKSCSIDFNHLDGARQAVTHLIRQGRRRIAFVGDHPSVAYARQRKAGYEKALHDAGIPVDKGLIVPATDDFSGSGHMAVEHLLRAGQVFDALFCIADVMALTAIQALVAQGRRVPENIAVVGYDDSPLAAWATPPLTSVRQDGVEMGRQAVDMLLRRISNPHASAESRVLPVQLVERASCGTGK